MKLEIKRYQLGGFDVALAARIGNSSRALAVHLDRLGQPTDRYREVEAYELRRIGGHLAAIKAEIAALPEIRLPWEALSVSQETSRAQQRTERRRDASPAQGRGRLHAHFAVPPGDE